MAAVWWQTREYTDNPLYNDLKSYTQDTSVLQSLVVCAFDANQLIVVPKLGEREGRHLLPQRASELHMC